MAVFIVWPFRIPNACAVVLVGLQLLECGLEPVSTSEPPSGQMGIIEGMGSDLSPSFGPTGLRCVCQICQS